MEVKVITTNSEAVSLLQHMLAHVRCTVDSNSIRAAKIEDGEGAIGLKLDLGVITRDALIFNDDIITELTTDIDDRFFKC